jgi:hypothetical protein
MKSKALLLLVSLALLSGCASGGLKTQPVIGRISLAQPLAERQAFFNKAKVSAIVEEGYVVNGQAYDEAAIKYYFKAFHSNKSVALSRSAHGARVSSTLLSALPPVIGVVVGAYVGLVASLSTTYGGPSSSADGGRDVAVGALAGALIGGLGISLPFGTAQYHKIEARRKEAAAIFNADLRRMLKLDGEAPQTPKAPAGADPENSIEP